MGTEWKTQLCSETALQQTLNEFELQGWDVWPQLIFFQPSDNTFIVVVSKDKDYTEVLQKTQDGTA